MAAYNNQSKSILETVTYLASLVSNPHDIEEEIDQVRTVTSHLSDGKPLSPKDKKALAQVEDQLRNYLLRKDSLRSFTRESLDRKVNEHFANTEQPVKHLRVIFGAFWILALIAGVLPFAIPNGFDMSIRGQLAALLFLNVMHVGTAWFFLTALSGFKPELRPAYIYICIGTIIVGLSQIQLPVVAIWRLSGWPWFHYGGFMVPFAVATALMYAGLRVYARVAGVRVLTSAPGFVGIAAIVAAATAIIPHSSQVASEPFFRLSLVALTLNALFAGSGAILAYRIAGRVGQIYGRALAMLFWTLLFATAGSLEYASVIFVLGQLAGAQEALAALPFIISELLMLQSGYLFKKTSLY